MLQRTVTVTAAIAVLACFSGCNSSSDTADSAHIRGTVSGLSTTNGRAVAVTSQGKAYWSNLDANGAFDLRVPARTNIRVFFASAPATGLHPIAGHLVGVGGSRWINATSGTTQLGVVRPATATSTTAGGVTTKSEGVETGADGADDDGAENESHDDDAEDDVLCGGDGATDVELHADAAPAGGGDDDDKGERDHEDESTRKACGN